MNTLMIVDAFLMSPINMVTEMAATMIQNKCLGDRSIN